MPSKNKGRKSVAGIKPNPSSSLSGAEDEVYFEVQRILRNRMCGSELPASLPHLQDQRRHLMDIIERCATQGESNSALVIGPRGSGKSMLLKHVLAELVKNRKVSTNLLQVRLNGLLQTDDRIAIQEITRQLKLENVAEEKVFDVVELLEKRVKSRFSHRQIHVFNTLTFDQYCEVFRKTLMLPSNFMDKTFAKEWNNHIEMLTEDATITEILQKTYSLDKSVRSLYSLMLLPISRIGADHPTFEGHQLLESRKIHSTDSKAAMLHGVSVLQLCLIIAMRHLTDLYEGDPFNFEMVYNEYQKFIQKKSHTVQQFDKSVVLKAFEHLVALELVKPAEHSTASSTRTQKEYRAMSILVTSSQLAESLSSYPSCPSELLHWAKNPMAS
ncbi:origin recognition complex subunit 4-like isoform X2 [Strongylocentrotus purpuratus]|uniref:Origin recognition complex subunit 4 n=1 Tax=Strongylocentrotus purpuratus TaxID=7668 RepID=A0A7M7SSW1_STRPU|nr:origin recognition complex subunit 4-like isoform X2 [Strongylocentrotus purpuratus]